MKKILLILIYYYSVTLGSNMHTPMHLHPQNYNYAMPNYPMDEPCIPLDKVIEMFKNMPSVTLHNSASAQNTTSVTTTIKQQISVISQNIQKITHTAGKQTHNIITQLSRHPYAVAGCSILCAYLYLVYKSLQIHYFLHNDLNWHSWKKELSVEQLCEITMANLSLSLMHTIQSLYINPHNPTDSITPLAKFLNTIDFEIKIIKQYIAISTWIRRLKLSLLLPKHKSLHELAQEKLRRLCFVKHVFTETIASQNSISVS